MISSIKNILVTVALMGLSLGCTDNSIGKQPGANREMYPDQESWGSRVIISRNGQLVAIAKSDRMEQFDKDKDAHLIGDVNIDFFNSSGEHVSHLLSDSANVNTQNNNLKAIGNVVIKSDSGMVLETNTINWLNAYEMLSTKDSVMFTSNDGDTLYGIGFDSDADLSHGNIYQPWGVTQRGFVKID